MKCKNAIDNGICSAFGVKCLTNRQECALTKAEEKVKILNTRIEKAKNSLPIFTLMKTHKIATINVENMINILNGEVDEENTKK